MKEYLVFSLYDIKMFACDTAMFAHVKKVCCKNTQFILLGCALIASVIATILSIICIAYLISTSTTTVPGWKKTNCTVTQIVTTNKTLTSACNCYEVDIWATNPMCRSLALMVLGFPNDCPNCPSEHFYLGQVLDCYISPSCETFEITMNHPATTKDNAYGPVIIISIAAAICFITIIVCVIYQIIREYRHVRIMELEKLINL